MKIAALSDRGLVRPSNQDAFWIGETAAAVADGMGGHAGGETASRLCMEATIKYLSDIKFSPKRALRKAFAAADSAVLEEAYRKNLSGIGSTLTAVAIRRNQAWIGHLGDSRAYRLRGKHLTQLTQDHSLVADMLHNGSLTPLAAKNHPRRHVITKAVGMRPPAEPDVFAADIEPKDRLILCTDGLFNEVGSEDLATAAESDNLEDACRTLVETAKNNGGRDNITVVVVEIGTHLPSKSRPLDFFIAATSLLRPRKNH